MARAIAAVVVLLVGLLAVACGDEATDGTEPATATVDVGESSEVEEPGPTEELSAPTEPPAPTATTMPPTPISPTATQPPPVTNRRDCGAISGTAYRSEEERLWYLDNCTAPPPTVPPPPADDPQPPPQANCSPSYPGVCIPPYPPDLNCGDITFRRFTVLPPDPHGFDGDSDGVGCESG